MPCPSGSEGRLSVRSRCLGTRSVESAAAVVLEPSPDISRMTDDTSRRAGPFWNAVEWLVFGNLPGQVEELSISFQSKLSSPAPCRGTEGNVFLLFGCCCWCSRSRCARAAVTWPAIRQVPSPYGNQMDAGVGVPGHRVRLGCSRDGISELRRHNPFSSSPRPTSSKNRQFQRYSLSLCSCPIYKKNICIYTYLICNCNFVCSKSSLWLS